MTKPVSASGIRLSIAAGMTSGTPAYREWHGSVVLTVPFDRLAAANDDVPRWPARAANEIAEPPRGASPEPPPEPSGEGTPMDAGAHSDAASPPPVAKPVRERGLDSSLARKTVAVARRVAGFGAGKRRLFAMARRARTAALLPELRLTGGRSSDASLRLSPTSADPYRYTQTGGNDLYAEATLTWRLDRLVFADAEIAVERLLDGRDAAEIRLVAEVLKQLFAWQRAKLRKMDTTLEPEQQALAALEEVQAEATLDVLTDGWFSRKVSKDTSNP